MAEIVSRVFLIAVLLFYAGLVVGFLLWDLTRWLRSSEKQRPGSTFLERCGARRLFNRPFGAR
jgi:hypothetical protein